MYRKNLTGKKFNRLTALQYTDNKWICRCDCGNIKEIKTSNLTKGRSKSCGCLTKEKLIEGNKKRTIHGHSIKGFSPTYYSYTSMKVRCYNYNRKDYKNYGGRGIFICRRWRNSFENFLADMGERPKEKTLDRIDTNGPYGKWNCKWSTRKEQANNKRR